MQPEPGTATSIKDIARAAKVSHSTVSRALRHSPLVNPKTAERIRRIARESNFQVSAAARSLATGFNNVIGVVVVTVSDPFVGEVVEGIEAAARARGYSVVLASFGADPDREMAVVQSFEEQRVAGIVINASHVGSRYLTQFSRRKVPIVLINNHQPGDFVYSVMIDNVAASEAATRYLLQLGHERIAYLGHRHGFQSDSERLTGYRQALAAAGQSVDPELVVHGDSTPEGAIRAVEPLLRASRPPTAIFCYNDVSAIGVLKAAHRHSLQVPEDLSVMGFDDVSIAPFTVPSLTTVRQPIQHMGRLATEILFQLIQGADAERSLRVRGELIVRESTAPPRMRVRTGKGNGTDSGVS